MSKRARTSGSRAIERRLNEGRGQGRGADYRPYIQVHDFVSYGQSNRIKSHLHGRTCHLHSKLEADSFFAFHALPNLKDLREQYPLELDETTAIADELGIVHPTDPKSRELSVVTTDFVLTFQNGGRDVDVAIAIKPAADLASSRVLEKLEIERVYWSARKINWHILTENVLPRAIVKNMRWLHPHLDLPESGEFSPEHIKRVRGLMESEIMRGSHPLVAIAAECDNRLGLMPGASLCVARYLIGTGAWPVELTVEIDPRKPLQIRVNGGTNVAATELAA